MRSPAAAIAWEFRQRHRVALVALAAYALVLVAVRLLIPGPGRPFTLDPPSGNAVAVIVPLGTTFMYFLAAFSFGLAGDVAGRLSIFPARMFTLPVTTRALAGWPMLLGAAAMASLWLVTASFVGWSWGLDLPLVWPALLGAVFLAWTQVLMWTAYGLPGLRVLLAVLWLAALAVVVILAVHLEVPEPRMVAMLAPQLPLAYLAACLAVARARRGDVPDWRGVFPRIGRLPRVLSPRRERFASPVRAQVWFEWRQRGLVLPALVGIVLPFELGLLHLASDEPAVLVGLTLLAVLLTPPFMAGFTAATAGPAGRDGDPAGVTLEATRPMTTATLVGARLRTALWSALAAWLLVVVAVPVALALTGSWPVVADGVGGFVEVVGRPRAVVLALLGFAGLLASTWKQLVQSLCLGLTGRAWVVRASVLVRLSLLVIAWPILDWVTDNGKLALARLWDGWPWILATLAGLKLAAAAWVVSRLHRSRLLRGRSLVAGAALWSAVVLALYGVLVWLVSTPEFVPRPFLALVAILAVPLVRLSAAPLALAWSRHRGARRRPDRESRASREGTWALRTTWALLALPLALVGAEAASHAVRNRNSGTLVSSGREREYLLHVPRRYDPAKPTPLVISMHGAGGWPAMQRDVSRWDALADSQGFIVVYPSGLRGRGPTIWRADRGSGLREDVRFISDLIDALKATYNVDPSRIYADGLSNGGGMAFVLSCTLSDRIAAVGLVASAQLLPFDWCTDPRPVPMIAFHGTADRLTPYEGGESWVVPRPLPDIPTFAADWARRNRCGSAPVESRVAADVRRLEYANCADDADVVLYAVGGGGHTWPGGGPLPEWLAGPTSRSVDATSEIWAFFRDHPLPAR